MKRRTRSLLGLVIWVATLPAVSQRAANQAPERLAAGQLIDSVVCERDPTQTYALYLPSAYTRARRWPIIYAFDPLAYGKVPVKRYQDAAEKYGYIIAGSNNSRNFSNEAPAKAITAMWDDTHARFALDERRVYTAGFSGGARVATMVALRCQSCQIAGVVAHGATYPSSDQPSEKDSFAYFATVGDQDFNWSEIVELRRKKEELGAGYRVRVFAGPHQWGPPAVVEEALAWMQLKAIQAGRQTRDAEFIDRMFKQTEAEASAAEKRGDAIAQLSAYRSLASDFNGLREVREYAEKLAALKKSSALREALKKEQDEIAEQRSLTVGISSKLAAWNHADGAEQMALRGAVAEEMTHLKLQADHAKNEGKRLVRMRAFHQVWAQGIEAGQAEFERKHFARAESYFELLGEITRDEPWPALLLAETRLAMGNRKRALSDIREAIGRGLRNPDVLQSDANLQGLRTDAEFLKIVEELKAKAQPAVSNIPPTSSK